MAKAGKVHHWKHGWIPIDATAEAIVARRSKNLKVGGAFWGSSRGRSFHMTGASADIMGGIDGFHWRLDDGSQDAVRRNAANMLRKIRDAEPRTKPLFHEEAMSASRFLTFQPRQHVRLPLTATGPSLSDADGYGRIKPEEDDGSKVRVMLEFAPGVKAYRYQAGEFITAGDFRVKEIRDDEPDVLFDYKRQKSVAMPIKRIVLEQVSVFDPDAT